MFFVVGFLLPWLTFVPHFEVRLRFSNAADWRTNLHFFPSLSCAMLELTQQVNGPCGNETPGHQVKLIRASWTSQCPATFENKQGACAYIPTAATSMPSVCEI